MTRYFAPTKVHFEPDSVDVLGEQLAGIQKVMVVTDEGIVATGILDHVKTSLTAAGVGVDVFDGVGGNPTVSHVQAAVDNARTSKAEALIAVGGGSPIDVAKAATVVLTNGGGIADYEGFERFDVDPLPLYAVPTTCGSGSEVTKGCVITNPDTNVKMIIVSDRLYPVAAFLDQRMIAGLPGHLVAVTGADALTHAMEAYLAQGANPFSDALVLAAIKRIFDHLGRAVAGVATSKHHVLIASCLAGLGFPNAGLGLVHAIANTLGGVYGIHHGTANAVLLPYVLEFNALAVPQRYCEIADAIGLMARDSAFEAPGAVVAQTRRLLGECGVPRSLAELGVGSDRIEEMAEMTLVQLDRPGNPRENTYEDIVGILEQALGDQS